MKKLKQVICGLMACLMLADPVGICSTAYAEENEPAEPKAILQMEPVEREGTSLQQEAGGSEQAVVETTDTSAPELDVSSLKMEYDAKLGGEATLTYRVTDESEIVYVSADIMVCANGLRTGNFINHSGGGANKDGIVTETFRLNFYGKYEIVSISVRDVWGNAAAYYNSAYSEYKGQLPAADLSIATISLPAPTEDNEPPVIDIDSIRLEKAVIANGEDNAMQLSVTDATGVAELHAQFRNIENGKTADAMDATALGEGLFSLQLYKSFPGKWQLFFIDAIDVCGNTIRLIDAKHPYYSETYGTENLRDLSTIVFEVESESFATPVIDLASLSIDKNISRNREPAEFSVNVENPDSVRQLQIVYIVTTDAGRSNDNASLSYNANLDKFRGWLYPSYFGKYEVEWINLLDYNGEWQTIYNSALSCGWTLPEDAVACDLSALNFDCVDARIHTMDGLTAALATAQDGESLQIAASENFVIDEDITIPKSVYLNIQSGSGSFKIAEGVTFTTESEFNCYVPMTVEGTWRSQSAYVDDLTISASGLIENSKDMHVENFRVEGSMKNKEQARMYSWNEFVLTSAGTLENYGKIYLKGNFALDGTVTEYPRSHIYCTYKAKTLDELKELLKQAKAGDTITVDPGNSAFVISEDVSVSKGVQLNISGDMVINAGVTFSTANLIVREVTVNGTWENRGNTYCREEVYVADTGIIRHSKGNEFYCGGGLRIAEGGLVENGGDLQISEKYENCGTLTNNTGATARLVLSVENATELKAALARENQLGEKEINFWVSDAVTLTEDTVIPKNTRLFVYDSSGNGAATLTVGEGATLTTRDVWYFECNVPLAIAGKWVNHAWGVELKKGLTITSTGCVDIEGGNIDLTGEFVNSGVLVGGSRITQLLTVGSMDELKSAVRGVGYGGTVKVQVGADFTISENFTVPKGVYLNIQSGSGSFKIAEGVTFTTESDFNCYVPMTVEGTWLNQSAYVKDLTISSGGSVENNGSLSASNFRVEGNLKNNEQAQIRSHENFELTSSGSLDNSGEIYLDGRFALEGKVTEHPGSYIYYTYKAKTLDELKELLEQVKAGDTITVDPGDSTFVISEDISVQEGVRLNISGALVINAGVTFTTTNLDVRGVTVNGTWENRGNAYCHQEEVYVADTGIIRHSNGYDFYCGGGLRIAEGGLVENNGHLYIEEKYENCGTLTNNAGATAHLMLSVRNAAELKAALACENPGEKEITFWVSDAVTLTEDVVISENTRLFVYDSSGNGAATLTVGEGATLTTQSDWYFECNVLLTVAGKWVNRAWGVKLNKGLTITSTGSIDSTGGSINLTGEFVNSGVLVGGSRITQLLTVASMDELRSAVQKVISGGKVEIRGNSDFVISEDITIPKGITVEVYEGIQNLRLDAGAKLTVDTGATLRSYTPVEVDGTVYNYGSIGARRGMTVNGTIHNYDYIRVEGGEFVGAENVVPYVTGACSVRKAYTVDSEESLRTTLSGLDLSAWNTLTAAEGFSLTEDITIPQGVYLNIQSGTFKVPEKVVLTTYSNLDVKNMVIDGTWINYMSMAGYGYSTVSGDFELSGTVKNSGWIQLVQYSRDMVNGIENTGNGSVTYGRGNGITSLEELRKEIDSAAGSYTDVYWDMDADTVLDADLVIPAGVDLYMGGGYTLVVPEGVELHVAEGAELKSYEGVLDVQGALRVDGNCRFETIKISGLLKNTGGLSFASMCITDSGKAEDAGVMIGSVDNQGKLCSVDRTDGGKVFEVGLWRDCDWNDAFRNVRHGDSIRFTGIWDNAHIIVNEDAILPEGVNIDGDIFTVKEGATLTTNGVLSAFTMEVEGTWVNNGPSEVSLLTIDGTVQNNASITVDRAYGTQNVTGKPIIIRSEADDITSPIRATILDLQDVLDSAPKGATIICEDYHTYYGEKPVAIINENITIPAGITVELTGVSKAYLTSGHTFTVNGTLVAAQPVYIAGSLVINGEVSIPAADEIDVEYLRYLGVTMGGINIVDGGSCEINGSIRVGKTDYSGQPITDPFSVLEGVDTSSLTQRTVDGCWYLTKKTAEGKADIFCELPTAGCSLRLVGADGSMKKLAPAGKGAAITNIAPGQYTLEVSKPGYVTHSVPLDTAAMADIFAVELVAVGNINGAESSLGDVDAADMQCLYTLLSTGSYDGQIKDEEYMKLVADVNGDGTINILDYQRLYMALNGAKA